MTSSKGRGHSRRDVLKTTGTALTWGMAASAFGAGLPKGVMAADMVEANVLTVLYPNGEGRQIDLAYGLDHHFGLFRSLMGDAVERIELRKANTPPSGVPQAFLAAANIWIADLAAWTAGLAKHGEELRASTDQFTNFRPVLQYDAVEGEMGQPRSAIEVGDACTTLLYANSEGVRWDVDYYKAHHMPTIMKLYGADAIKRFELRKGAHGMTADAGAPYIGTVNIYVGDAAKFAAAGKEHGAELLKDVANFSSINPSGVGTTVYGVV